MTFYTYNQNNSGGYYNYNEKDGIAPYIIVEAPNKKMASLKFWDITTFYSEYCECCGERWDDYSPDEGEVPMIYDRTVEEHLERDTWLSDHKEVKHRVAIHYLDGTIKLIK